MNKIEGIINNPLYLLLFGSGGVLVIIISVISIKVNGLSKKRKDKDNLNLDIGSSKKYDFDAEPMIDKEEEYQVYAYRSEEYYITFLKTVEEKKKAGDEIVYK